MFNIVDNTISQIAKQWGISPKIVKKIYLFYKEFSINLEQQYLAHIIRTVEEYLREITENNLFTIRCQPYPPDSQKLDIASAQYFKNDCFIIFYHPKMDKKQVRIQIAHELGHMFFLEMANKILGKEINKNISTEPFATVLGIFMIADKNNFYYSMLKDTTAPFIHDSLGAIISDFILLDDIRKNKLKKN